MSDHSDAWAIVQDADQRTVNTVVWDGVTPWNPPVGTYALQDWPIAIGWYRDPANEIWLMPPNPLYDENGEPVPGPVFEEKEDQLGRMHTWRWENATWWLEVTP